MTLAPDIQKVPVVDALISCTGRRRTTRTTGPGSRTTAMLINHLHLKWMYVRSLDPTLGAGIPNLGILWKQLLEEFLGFLQTAGDLDQFLDHLQEPIPLTLVSGHDGTGSIREE